MQKNDWEMKVKILAIGFMSFPLVSDEKRMKSSGYIETDMSIFTKDTMKNLCTGVAKAKINMKHLVMIMEFEDGRKLYLNSMGVVKIGKKEYYIYPWLFVYVWSLITIHQEQSRGVKDVFVKIS